MYVYKDTLCISMSTHSRVDVYLNTAWRLLLQCTNDQNSGAAADTTQHDMSRHTITRPVL